MKGFHTRVDDEASMAAPVFVLGEGVNSVDVGCGIAARENGPEEIVQGSTHKRCVINQHDQRESVDGSTAVKRLAEPT